jgi:hypothetical protein
MATENQDQTQEADLVYERYGKPLEQEHRGEFLAVSRDGRTLLAPTLLDAVDRASETFGPGNFVYKIGDKIVGKWLRVPTAS